MTIVCALTTDTDLLGRLTGDPGHEPGEEKELTGTLLTRPRVSSLQRLENE